MPTATILPQPNFVAYDANGDPLTGGFVYTYVANTTTPKTTWADGGEVMPNQNPVVLDAAGAAAIYGSGAYSLVTTDSLGNQVPAYSGLTTDTLSAVTSLTAQLASETAIAPGAALVGYNSGFTAAIGTTVEARVQADFINAVGDFGVPTDGTTDCSVTLQAAINASQTHGGKKIYLPGLAAGYKVLNELSITAGTEIFGDGPGTGPGNASTVGGTLLVKGDAAKNIISIATTQPVYLHDLFFGSSVAASSTGAGILVAGSGGAANGNSRFDRLGFTGHALCIKFTAATLWNVTNSYFGAWTTAAIWNENTVNNDAGDNWVAGCKFFGDQNGAQQAGIRVINAPGLMIQGNKFLGGEKHIWLAINGAPTGTVLITGNSFEQFSVSALYCEQFGTQPFGNVVFSSNEVSTNTPVTPQSAVAIVAAGSPWISNITIADNVFNMGTMTAAYPLMNIQDGLQGTITGNVMNCGSTTNTVGITVAGNALNWSIGMNRWTSGGAGAVKYNLSNAATTILNLEPDVSFANLPTPADGSMFFVPNGTFGSNPLTGGGTGAFARRIAGAWVGT